MSFVTDLRFAFRSLLRARGLTITVVLTLALGMAPTPPSSASSAACCCGRCQPRRGPPDLHPAERAGPRHTENAAFSVPEIDDLQARVKIVTAFGDFSDDRLHDGGSRRAARRPRRRRRRRPTSR